jgi:hypothetical protein
LGEDVVGVKGVWAGVSVEAEVAEISGPMYLQINAYALIAA